MQEGGKGMVDVTKNDIMIAFIEQLKFHETQIVSENQIYTGWRCAICVCACVCWLISWLYPAVDVKDLISCSSGEFLLSAYHLEDLALKSCINIEQFVSTPLILERLESRSPKTNSN